MFGKRKLNQKNIFIKQLVSKLCLKKGSTNFTEKNVSLSIGLRTFCDRIKIKLGLRGEFRVLNEKIWVVKNHSKRKSAFNLFQLEVTLERNIRFFLICILPLCLTIGILMLISLVTTELGTFLRIIIDILFLLLFLQLKINFFEGLARNVLPIFSKIFMYLKFQFSKITIFKIQGTFYTLMIFNCALMITISISLNIFNENRGSPDEDKIFFKNLNEILSFTFQFFFAFIYILYFLILPVWIIYFS